MENLSSSNLLKNHNLAFAISDVSWCEFKTFLEYKASKNGTVVACGVTHERDVNAALNVLEKRCIFGHARPVHYYMP